MNEEINITYDECPKCKNKELIVNNWIDGFDKSIIWLTITCNSCYHRWREMIKIDG